LSTEQTGILKILKFTNNLTGEEVILEECGEFYEVLNGYYIALPRQYFSDMKFYLNELYGKYSDIIEEAFLGSDEKIVQLCCIARGHDTYTDMFIKNAGGADNLIGNGIVSGFSEDELENLEEEEMYKELYEKTKKELEKALADKDAELEKAMSTISKLESDLNSAKGYKEIFESFDSLEDDDLGLVLDVLERRLNPQDYNRMVFDLLSVNAGDEGSKIEDLKILRVYVNQIANWLSENNFLG